jgi:hypothetical protein
MWVPLVVVTLLRWFEYRRFLDLMLEAQTHTYAILSFSLKKKTLIPSAGPPRGCTLDSYQRYQGAEVASTFLAAEVGFEGGWIVRKALPMLVQAYRSVQRSPSKGSAIHPTLEAMEGGISGVAGP